MPQIGWVDTADATHAALLDELWPDSASLPLESLDHYLQVAHEECVAYLAGRPEPTPTPARFVQAQIMQARARRASGLVDSSDQIGADGMTVRVYPMDRTVKALLRPRRGRPVIL